MSCFFGALLGVWIVEGRDSAMAESWWFALVVIIGYAFTALLLTRVIFTPESSESEKPNPVYYGFILVAALILTFVSSAITEADITNLEFLRSPSTWVFFIIIASWIATDSVYRKMAWRGGT